MLNEILDRIEGRLKAVGLDATNASLQAGLGEDAIRNIRRTVKADKPDAGASTTTLIKLAPVLQTTVAWLIEGSDASVERLSPHQRVLWEIFKKAINASPEVQDRIAAFAEFQLSNYEKSLEMATNAAE